jgi:hypothetical protein
LTTLDISAGDLRPGSIRLPFGLNEDIPSLDPMFLDETLNGNFGVPPGRKITRDDPFHFLPPKLSLQLACHGILLFTRAPLSLLTRLLKVAIRQAGLVGIRCAAVIGHEPKTLHVRSWVLPPVVCELSSRLAAVRSSIAAPDRLEQGDIAALKAARLRAICQFMKIAADPVAR